MGSTIGTCSLGDRIHGVVALLKSCPDLGALQFRHATIVRRLEARVERARVFRLRTGHPAALDGLAWLSEVIATHPAFESRTAEAQAMQGELQQLVAKIAHGQ
jgi:hypothetical protein